VQLPSNGVC